VMRVWSAESWEVVRGYDWGAGGLTCVTATADGLAGDVDNVQFRRLAEGRHPAHHTGADGVQEGRERQEGQSEEEYHSVAARIEGQDERVVGQGGEEAELGDGNSRQGD